MNAVLLKCDAASPKLTGDIFYGTFNGLSILHGSKKNKRKQEKTIIPTKYARKVLQILLHGGKLYDSILKRVKCQ
jgi:hypothetical protein